MDPGEPSLLFRAIPQKLRLNAAEKRDLRQFARDLSARVADGRAFACLITNDRQLRSLNRQFLAHDYPTDVLSFPSHGDGELGDLAISAERAEAQAQHFGHSRLEEIRVLMLHGLLHLTGLDHESDRGKMFRAEQKWRAEFGLPDTLIARAAVNGGGKR
jgi:probable rRNA maturation factor